MLRKLILSALAVVSVTASAQQIKVEKYSLPNGMTVILHEDHTLPVVAINTWYHVGSKDEPDRRSGFAHLFEHLMFMGTKRVPNGQFDRIMEGGGGSNNASTAEDRTNYFSVGPSNLLPTLLWLDADRLEDLGKSMDQKKVDLQREVVKNERRQRTENTPYGRAYEAINSILFPKGHPYDHSVIGSMADLDAASVLDVQDFFATYYVPNNASLVVAGDFNPLVIRPLIDRLFGTLPRRNDPIHRAGTPPKINGTRRVTMVDKVQFAKIIMLWHSPAAYKTGDAEMQLAGSILSDGLTSRLYERLVVKDKLATDVTAAQGYPDGPLALGSLFGVDATAAQGVDLAHLERAIDETLTEFTSKGPTPAELQRAIAKIQYGSVASLQSVANVADKLNEFEFYLGTPDAFKQVLSTYEKATPEGIRSASQKVLNLDQRLILRVLPESPSADGASARDTKPIVGSETVFVPDKPNIFRLSNGLKVEYWSRPKLPLMSVSMMFRGGASLDPESKEGLSQLTSSMLDQGAGNLDAASFHNALDLLGATVSASSGAVNSSVGLSVLSRNFGAALNLYADAIQRPRFEGKELDRVRRIHIAELQEADDNPTAVARKVAAREFFGAKHPYGRPASGTPESVGIISIADIKSLHSRNYGPQNATVFVAGSLGVADVKRSLEASFGKWKTKGDTVNAATTLSPTNKTYRVIIVDKPGAVQTVIRFMAPAPDFMSPDREVLTSLGTLLGGSFTSRLNQNIREAHGYAYGASAGFQFTPVTGYFVAASNVRSDVTGASIKEFLNEFRRLESNDISVEEATKVSTTRRADLVTALGGDGVLNVAQNYEINGRPFGQLTKDIAILSGIDAPDLNSHAKGAIRLSQGLLVLVGDKSTILKQIEGLNLPKPEIKTATK
jgi:zinc protease